MEKSKAEDKSRYWRDMHNLINSAPTFNGTEDVDFWWHEMTHYLNRNQVDDSTTICNIVIGTLEGSAREWFGSLRDEDCDKTSLVAIIEAIQARYGKTTM